MLGASTAGDEVLQNSPKDLFLWLSCLFHVSLSEDKHMEILMIVTGPPATQAWSSFKKIGITLNPSSVQTTFRYVDVSSCPGHWGLN